MIASRKIRLIMQLRSAGIADTDVLSAMEQTAREAFVPRAFLDQAYDNHALPIGHGQTLSQPQVVAMMTQALKVSRRTKVLEIGTGSGYQAAVLSKLCRRLYTVERYRELLALAEARFKELRIHNITTRLGDGWKGWPEQAPFDRIMVTAAPPEVPGALVDQLKPDGILVVPVGRSAADQALLRIQRDEEGRISEETLGGVRFVPLVHGLPKAGERPRDEDAAAVRREPVR